jgi:hypothetical protein
MNYVDQQTCQTVKSHTSTVHDNNVKHDLQKALIFTDKLLTDQLKF